MLMSEKFPFYVESKPLTRVDSLREGLDRLDSCIGRLGKIDLGAEALEIPALFDQAYEILEELDRDGSQIPEEVARFETMASLIKQKAPAFLRAIGGTKALRHARQTGNPGPERWWWYLDQWLAQEKQKQAKRFVTRAVILGIVLVVLVILYQAFLAPSPEEEALITYEGMADRYISEGNLESALGEIDKALAIAPRDPGLLIRKGVLLQALDQEQEVEAVFAQAESEMGSRKEFLLSRGQIYLNVGMIEAGIADSQEILRIEPQAPEAYLMLGQGYELQGNYFEAIQAYEEASRLATEQDRPELTALARVRLAYLMQRIPAGVP